MEQVTLNVIDGIIIICYLVGIIGDGILKGKQQFSEDYNDDDDDNINADF